MRRGLCDGLQRLNPFLSHWIVEEYTHNLIWDNAAVVMYRDNGEIIVRDRTSMTALHFPPSLEWVEGEAVALRAAVEQIGLMWPEEWAPL